MLQVGDGGGIETKTVVTTNSCGAAEGVDRFAP